MCDKEKKSTIIAIEIDDAPDSGYVVRHRIYGENFPPEGEVLQSTWCQDKELAFDTVEHYVHVMRIAESL